MKQLILLLVVAALAGSSLAQGNRKCAANGEYCLTHSECCSGSCLSFSYKCVPTPPGAIVGTTFVPAPVETGNRFGGSGGSSVDSGTGITQKTCAKNGEYCLTHSECCSGSCLSFSYKCVPVPGTSSVDQQQPQRPQSPAPASGSTTNGSFEPTTVDLGNRIGEGDQSTTGTTAAVSFSTAKPAKCAAVGEYCLTSADCCSRSCLSFSYKCVQNYDLGTQQLTPSGIPVQLPAGGGSSLNTIDTANRFGGGSDNRQCLANGHACFYGQECCSGACFRSFCATQINLGIPESALTRPSASNGPYVQVSSLDELISRFGGGGGSGGSQPAGGDSSASASLQRANIGVRSGVEKHCAVVGESCSRQEDCCSMRCHSYRRKCVT